MKTLFLIYISCLMFYVAGAQKKEIAIGLVTEATQNPNSLIVNHSVDIPVKLEARHLTNITYVRKTRYGSIVGIWQKAERFSAQDIEFNVELYPKLTKSTYAYLGGGLSTKNTLFPEHRFGAEIFHVFSKNYEASLGFRHLNFLEQKVTFYTASIGKYHKNFWYLLRTYYNPEDVGKSLSIMGQVRKYGKNANQFYNISMSFGRGFSEVGLNEYFSQTTYRISLGLQQGFIKNIFINPQIDYRLDETLNTIGQYQSTFIFSLSAMWLF